MWQDARCRATNEHTAVSDSNPLLSSWTSNDHSVQGGLARIEVGNSCRWHYDVENNEGLENCDLVRFRRLRERCRSHENVDTRSKWRTVSWARKSGKICPFDPGSINALTLIGRRMPKPPLILRASIKTRQFFNVADEPRSTSEE